MALRYDWPGKNSLSASRVDTFLRSPPQVPPCTFCASCIFSMTSVVCVSIHWSELRCSFRILTIWDSYFYRISVTRVGGWEGQITGSSESEVLPRVVPALLITFIISPRSDSIALSVSFNPSAKEYVFSLS